MADTKGFIAAPDFNRLTKINFMQNATFVVGDYFIGAVKLTKILMVIYFDIVVTVLDLMHAFNFQEDNRKSIYLSYCLKSNELIR